MYNFLVTAERDAWDSRSYQFARERFCEYTAEQIKTRFVGLTTKAIKELTSIPSLFAYEGTTGDVRVGHIRNIEDRGRSVYFEFEFDTAIQAIPFGSLEPLRLPLDMASRWELNRTHWAIKDVDLLTVLASAGVIDRSNAPQKLDPRQFVKSAIEASIFARPDSPGLAEDELESVAKAFNYKRGEIADAVESAIRARELIQKGARVLPGTIADRFDSFTWRDAGDLRNPRAFEAVHLYMHELAREHGIRAAVAKREFAIDHAVRVDGVPETDAKAAITCLLLAGHFEEEASDSIRLVAGRERWSLPNEQLKVATSYDRGEPRLSTIRDEITKLGSINSVSASASAVQGEDPMEDPYSLAVSTADLGALELDVREVPFTVSTLLQKIGKNQLILTPAFQRRQVWKVTQQSRFIEAILLNYPLPPLFLNQDREGRYLVIDGLQRTSTLKDFNENRFALQDLERLSSLNGRRWQDLPTELHSRIEDRTLNCYVLKPSVPLPVINDIFARINTGGTELNRQEIRHALYQGPATLFLDEISSIPEYKNWIGVLLNPNRMGDVEAALRCVAFARVAPEAAYKDDMDDFLVGTMKELNASSEDERVYLKQDFARVWPVARRVFGENAFRLSTPQTRGRINLAITESVYRFITKHSDVWIKKNALKLSENYGRLLKDSDYLDAVRYATGDKNRVRTRFRLAQEQLGAGCVD